MRELPFLILAIIVHNFNNFLVSLGIVGLVISVFAFLIFVVTSMCLVRNKIKSLDISKR